MDLLKRSVALYGRFSAGERERLRGEIEARGGRVARDFMRRSDLLVIGALAVPLIDIGALALRLAAARARNVPIYGEARFAAALARETPEPAPSLPLATALGPSGLTREQADILAAFDLIRIEGENCRFGDAQMIRTAGELSGQGRSFGVVVQILRRAKGAPTGRHKIVLTPEGDAALEWDEGRTTLDGQGLLPLDVPEAGVDELFEAAEIADLGGEQEDAVRLYEMCAASDRSDAIAPYNLGNIRLAQGNHDADADAYQRALARDPDFIEAHYNFALALEGLGKMKQAASELESVLALDPEHDDATFNLAQIFLNGGDHPLAKALFERYLTLNPPADGAATARKAIHYLTAKIAMG